MKLSLISNIFNYKKRSLNLEKTTNKNSLKLIDIKYCVVDRDGLKIE